MKNFITTTAIYSILLSSTGLSPTLSLAAEHEVYSSYSEYQKAYANYLKKLENKRRLATQNNRIEQANNQKAYDNYQKYLSESKKRQLKPSAEDALMSDYATPLVAEEPAIFGNLFSWTTAIGLGVIGAAALALGGGGGGGGSSNAIVYEPVAEEDVHPESNVLSSYNTTEANLSGTLGTTGAGINAFYAYARGYDGRIFNRAANGALLDDAADGNVRVAVIDGEIDINHTDLDGNILSSLAATCFTTSNSCTVGSSTYLSPDTHGTFVSGIIAAEDNSSGIHGVAPQAKIIPISAIGVTNGSDVLGLKYAIDNNAEVINASYGLVDGSSRDIPIVTATQGNAGDAPTQAEVNYVMTYTEAGTSYSEQFSRLVTNDVIIVYAAGNDSMNQVSILAGLPYYFNGTVSTANPSGLDWRGHFVASVSVDSSQNISSFSNQCGVAKDWCIATLGEDVVSTTINNSTTTSSGTSFSAPVVSGALAVMKGAFPHLTSDEILTIIFDTADDLGATGVDDVYGHGLLNLNKATSPETGNWVLYSGEQVSGLSVNQAEYTVQNTNLTLNQNTFSELQAKNYQFMFFDKYKRNFYLPLNSMILEKADYTLFDNYSYFKDDFFYKSSGNSERYSFNYAIEKAPNNQQYANHSQTLLKEGVASYFEFAYNDIENSPQKQDNTTLYKLAFGNDIDPRKFVTSRLQQGFTDGFAQMQNPYLSFSNNAKFNQFAISRDSWQVSFGMLRGQDEYSSLYSSNEDQIKSYFSEFIYQPQSIHTSLAFEYGVTDEQNGYLGNQSSGAFGLSDSSKTYFTTIKARHDFSEKYSLLFNYSMAKTDVSQAEGSFISGDEDIYSNSFALGFQLGGVFSEYDKLSSTIIKPITVNSGAFDIRFPSGVDAEGNISYTSDTINLKQEDNLDLAFNYALGESNQTTNSNNISGKLNLSARLKSFNKAFDSSKDRTEQNFTQELLARYNLSF